MIKQNLTVIFTLKHQPFPSEESFETPEYQSQGSSGVDLWAWIPQVMIIKPQERMLIPTGLSLEIPDGFEGQVRSRSGLALKHGLMVLNSPGTIDADYRGEIQVVLHNGGHEAVSIFPGMRIAQLVISPVVQCSWERVSHLGDTLRGEKGFGSTGL